jgi:hypothetical protein
MREVGLGILRWSIVTAAACALSGCATAGITPAEFAAGEAYIPLNPQPINLAPGTKRETLLNGFPNETMRISVGTVDASGSLSFGVAQIGSEGHSYTVIVDYIKYTTATLPVEYVSQASDQADGTVLHQQTLKTNLGSITFRNVSIPPKIVVVVSADGKKLRPEHDEVTKLNPRIPVYFGVGLRIQANVQVVKGSFQIASLYGLGLAASAGKLTGSLIVQTLGIHGEGVSALIPLPSEINESSIQSAMQALAAIKAKLFDGKTNVTPQVIGMESLFQDTQARQFLISQVQSSNAVLSPTVDGELRPALFTDEQAYLNFMRAP